MPSQQGRAVGADNVFYWALEHRLRGVDEAVIERLIELTARDPALVSQQLAEAENAALFPLVRALSQQVASLGSFLEALQLTSVGGDPASVDELFRISRTKFYESYFEVNRPVIIRGLVASWPALQQWSPEVLKARYGDYLVDVMSDRDSPEFSRVRSGSTGKVRLGEFLDWMSTARSNDRYLVPGGDFFGSGLGAALLEDIGRMPSFLSRKPSRPQMALWCGPADTVTDLHFDPKNVLLVQIWGSKVVRLISPAYSHRLYNRYSCFSDVDCERPDLDEFPLFTGVAESVVTLEPGDAVFLPVGWWHHVRALNASISLSLTNFLRPNTYRWSYPRILELWRHRRLEQPSNAARTVTPSGT